MNVLLIWARSFLPDASLYYIYVGRQHMISSWQSSWKIPHSNLASLMHVWHIVYFLRMFFFCIMSDFSEDVPSSTQIKSRFSSSHSHDLQTAVCMLLLLNVAYRWRRAIKDTVYVQKDESSRPVNMKQYVHNTSTNGRSLMVHVEVWEANFII